LESLTGKVLLFQKAKLLLYKKLKILFKKLVNNGISLFKSLFE